MYDNRTFFLYSSLNFYDFNVPKGLTCENFKKSTLIKLINKAVSIFLRQLSIRTWVKISSNRGVTRNMWRDVVLEREFLIRKFLLCNCWFKIKESRFEMQVLMKKLRSLKIFDLWKENSWIISLNFIFFFFI